MRKLNYAFLILFSLSCFMQGYGQSVSYIDSCINVKIPVKTIHDTLVVYRNVPFAVHDTIYKCPPVIPPVTPPVNGIWRGCYINSTSSIIGNKVKEDALIADLNKYKFNHISCYSLDGANDLSASNLFKRIRKETFVTDIGATGGSGSSFTGARSLWNNTHADSSDYNSFNLEFEAYNNADVPGAWSANIQYLQQMYSCLKSGTVKYIYDYFGWWSKEPMLSQTPDTLVKYITYQLLHNYQTTPSFAYMKGRCDNLNTSAKKRGVVMVIRPILSAEPAFSQNYLKTHSLDQAYTVIKTAFDLVGYTNLKMDGYMVFHLDFLRASSPPSAVARLRANYSDDSFQNTTTPEHLKMSVNPNDN